MDLSKLPKLSETPKPPSNEPQKEYFSNDHANLAAVEAGTGAMLWISLILGLLCMAIGRSFGSYAIAKLTGREHHTHFNWSDGPLVGTEVAYWDLQGFVALTDTGIFLFGLAMILEGVALAIVNSKLGGKKIVLAISLAIIAIATVINLFAAMKVMGTGLIPLMSGMAAGLGGYMAIYQWKLLRVLSSGRSVPMT